MSAEIKPQVHFDYKGILSDQIGWNTPVGEGFMQSADMRSSIVIARAADDLISNVYLQFSADGKLIIAINDGKLWREVRDDRSLNGTQKEDRFIRQFENAVNSGLKKCLSKEKWGNNEGFLIGAISYLLMGADASVNLFIVAGSRSIPGAELNDMAIKGGVIALSILGSNFLINNINHMVAYDRDKNDTNANTLEMDPFIRRTFLGKFLFPVPFEKYIAGRLYVAHHSHEFITVEGRTLPPAQSKDTATTDK